jgi:hypothetical protein
MFELVKSNIQVHRTLVDCSSRELTNYGSGCRVISVGSCDVSTASNGALPQRSHNNYLWAPSNC